MFGGILAQLACCCPRGRRLRVVASLFPPRRDLRHQRGQRKDQRGKRDTAVTGTRNGTSTSQPP
jgi:hypothetical protein